MDVLCQVHLDSLNLTFPRAQHMISIVIGSYNIFFFARNGRRGWSFVKNKTFYQTSTKWWWQRTFFIQNSWHECQSLVLTLDTNTQRAMKKSVLFIQDTKYFIKVLKKYKRFINWTDTKTWEKKPQIDLYMLYMCTFVHIRVCVWVFYFQAISTAECYFTDTYFGLCVVKFIKKLNPEDCV